ncbi:substrate-binding domain-containing protein [Corynebacterium glucuronolyticum]|uniref:substrate-binding domain-containing protein n=1 Tax=Corynebacterium glucuronolyticum TaxID=39791 RepID=UPI00223AEB67|nr:substrate-binding domain-containing protein [Corynebacterium glucuronolyticum]MCT1443288.1 substrate-binding domain-containing protein [Corynebacterium glucuronolyticum]
MKKFLMAGALIASLSLSGCGAIDTGTGEASSNQANPESGAPSIPENCNSSNPTLAVLLPNLANPYYVAMKNGFEDEGKSRGFNVKVQIANDDDSQQLSQAQAMLQDRPCALALNPVNSEPAAAIVKSANDLGIPVFNVNVGVSEKALSSQGASIVQYLGADNVDGGRVMGEQMLKDFGEDSALEIGLVTAPDQTIVVSRDDGFKEAISSNPNAKVVSTVDGKVQLDTSVNVTSAMLQGNPTMNAIFASTGPAAQGALQAVQASGRDVKVYGFCASEIPLTDSYPGCVAQEPEKYGREVVDQIHTFVESGEVESEILKPLKQFTKGQTPAPGEVG